MRRRIAAITALAMLAIPPVAYAIVIRHDVPDARHRVADDAFPALADLPGEGHGVLIAPQWIATAAHAVSWQPVTQAMVNGKPRAVDRIVVHSGYRKLPDALANGPTDALMAFLAASDDIALIRLAEPVRDVRLVALNDRDDELGKRVVLYGKGATGNGRDGQQAGRNRTELRRAYNRVSAVEPHWLVYEFDADARADALEGVLGNGDSGGPVLLQRRGRTVLAGLASWKHWRGDMATFRAGVYGQAFYQVRISHYAPWIREVVAADSGQARAGG